MILSTNLAISQTSSEKIVIDFFPLKVVDTIYSQNQINQINEKDFFYIDENTVNEDLFICSIQREKEIFGEIVPLSFEKTLIRKIKNKWVLYDYESYWGLPDQSLVDNTFYIIRDVSGNSGHHIESGGSWNWGKETIYFLDYKKMTISSEITTSYGYVNNYLENEEDIEKYHKNEEDNLNYISTSIECGIEYAIQNSILIIDPSYCKNETIRNKGKDSEIILKTDTDCVCPPSGEYHYIDGKFLKKH